MFRHPSSRSVLRLSACLGPLAVLAALSACSGSPEPQASEAAKGDPLAGLEIETAKAAALSNMPVGSVPGRITLPPEARVAVTAPFPGAAVRVYVIEGQAVRKGQPLALVRAAEPVQIQGQLARAEAELGLAKARAARLSQLAGEGVIAQARADEGKAALAQAEASLAEQRRLASLGGVGPDGTMTLSAPISGRVAHVGVETGGPVDGMAAPFVVEAAGAYQVEMQLPERLARAVRPGMAVEIALPAQGGSDPVEVGGQILAVAPSIDPETRSVLARARIGAAPGVVAGRNVTVRISGASAEGGIAVPSSAITRIDGADHVFVRKGKSYAPRKVEVVTDTGESAVIAEGLKAGEVVAVKGVAELKAMGAE